MGKVGVTGKKGVALSLNTLGIAFLTIAVVVVVVAIFNSNAFDLAEGPLAEVAKLVPIGKPKILAFNVHQSAPDSREFTVSYEIGGNLKDFKELFVRKSHKKYYNDAYPNQRTKMSRSIVREASILNDAHRRKEIRDPNVKAGYTLYELILETSRGEVYDVKEIKTYDENYLEMHNRKPDFCDSEELPLCRGGKEILYDNKKCDVIECKKQELSFEEELRTCSRRGGGDLVDRCLVVAGYYLEKISDGSCGRIVVDGNMRRVKIDTTGCTDNQQIEKLSKKMGRVNLAWNICESLAKKMKRDNWRIIFWEGNPKSPTYLSFPFEESYNLLSHTEFEEAVNSAVGKTNSCVQEYEYTDPEGNPTKMTGAKEYFKRDGFVQMGDFNRENDVREELYSALPPNIGDFKIIPGGSTGLLARYFYINRKGINSVTIDYCLLSHAIDREFITHEGGGLVEGASIDCEQTQMPSEILRLSDENKYVQIEIGDKITRLKGKPGMYEATITINGNRRYIVKGGMYNEEYLEKYASLYTFIRKDGDRSRGDEHTTVCVEDPRKRGPSECNGNNDDDAYIAECEGDCDVIDKKREVFKTPNQKTDEIKTSIRIDTYDAWKYRNPESGCTLIEKTGWRIKNHYRLSDSTCTPEEVYELYEELFKAAYTYMQNDLNEQEADDIDLYCSTIFDKKLKGAGGGHGSQHNKYDKFFGIEDGTHGGAVCVAKDNLKKKLDALGWVDSS